MCSKRADLESLGRCALELIVARWEIEQGRYNRKEKSKLLKRVEELEKSIVSFVSFAIAARKIKTTSYGYEKQINIEKYGKHKYFQ